LSARDIRISSNMFMFVELVGSKSLQIFRKMMFCK